MFKYFGTIIAVALGSIALLLPQNGKRAESLKTSPCLKCDDGIGQLKKSANGKYSYKCDNCGSSWVERRG